MERQRGRFASTAPFLRFLAKLELAPGPLSEPCWRWKGARGGGRNGVSYGKFRDGFLDLAHRWAYRTFRGRIPEGRVLDHLCGFPLCVNPWHLEPVCPEENLLRRESEPFPGSEEEEFEHRAAVYEYDGGLGRRQAESRARQDLDELRSSLATKGEQDRES